MLQASTLWVDIFIRILLNWGTKSWKDERTATRWSELRLGSGSVEPPAHFLPTVGLKGEASQNTLCSLVRAWGRLSEWSSSWVFLMAAVLARGGRYSSPRPIQQHHLWTHTWLAFIPPCYYPRLLLVILKWRLGEREHDLICLTAEFAGSVLPSYPFKLSQRKSDRSI